MQENKLKVLYFGVYDPDYARNWVLINGLKKNGVEVVELRRRSERFSLFWLFFDYLKFKKDFNVMIVGFPGQEVMFLARLLVWQKPIIFDAFTSHYGGYILDRQKYSKESFHAKYYRFLDRWSCKLADLVLLDTQAHINFFVTEFNLSKEKFRRIWVGVPGEEMEMVITEREPNKFKVTFFGTYIPLQGIEYIIKAAKILEGHLDIVFTLIGSGQDKKKIENFAEELRLKNVIFHGMFSLENLRQEMASSDICLGIFGTSSKTRLVIPNKVYEAVALGKPVITADTEAIRELFNENDMVLVPTGNAEALAVAIVKLRNDPALRDRLAVNVRQKFIDSLTYQIIGQELKDILLHILITQIKTQ